MPHKSGRSAYKGRAGHPGKTPMRQRPMMSDTQMKKEHAKQHGGKPKKGR